MSQNYFLIIFCFFFLKQMTYDKELADILLNELSDLTVFIKLLKYGFAKKKIIKCFTVSGMVVQKFSDFFFLNTILFNFFFQFLDANNKPIANEIAKAFTLYIQDIYLSYNNRFFCYATSNNDPIQYDYDYDYDENNECLDENFVEPAPLVVDNKLGLDDVTLYQISESGLRIGSFLCDAGWIEQSILILKLIYKIIEKLSISSRSITYKLDCLER